MHLEDAPIHIPFRGLLGRRFGVTERDDVAESIGVAEGRPDQVALRLKQYDPTNGRARVGKLDGLQLSRPIGHDPADRAEAKPRRRLQMSDRKAQVQIDQISVNGRPKA